MPQEPPDLSAHIASALPGIDAGSTMLLMRASRLGRLVELYRGRLASLDSRLDATSHAVLGALLLLGPPYRLTPTFLRRHVLQTSGGMTRTLRRLEGEGLVTRVADEHDGRISYVQLTPEGKDLATESHILVLTEWENALEARGVDVDEAMAVVTTLLEVLETLTGARLGRDLGL
jgi:DNA-binding MarR family transcriptional regulator